MVLFRGAASGTGGSKEILAHTWSVYLRDTFEARAFYRFETLAADLFFFILDSKTLAGREQRGPDDAQARPMVLTFFETMDSDPGTVVVRRVDRGEPAMATKVMTCAELLLAAGCP